MSDESGGIEAVFDPTGKPLTPSEGINFGGRLGLMQGIIVAPDGDVWSDAVDPRVAYKLCMDYPSAASNGSATSMPGAISSNRPVAAAASLLPPPDPNQVIPPNDVGTLRPVLDRTFPFDRTLDAMAYVEQGKAAGKVV